jgi:hypothetical protein
LLRFEANAVGWGSDGRRLYLQVIAAASSPPTRLALLPDLPFQGRYYGTRCAAELGRPRHFMAASYILATYSQLTR